MEERMKKIITFCLVSLFVLYVVGAEKINLNKFINLTKKQIIKKIGNEYEEIETGAEMSSIGLFYKKYGMTIVFDENSNYIDYIECNKNFDFLGAKAGMKYKEIFVYLGEKRIKETYVEPIYKNVFLKLMTQKGLNQS
jgi:hypothetical protein